MRGTSLHRPTATTAQSTAVIVRIQELSLLSLSIDRRIIPKRTNAHSAPCGLFGIIRIAGR